MALPFKRTIRATTVVVGPRADDPTTQVFALCLSAGLDVANATDDARQHVLPWNWRDLKVGAWAKLPAHPDPIECVATLIDLPDDKKPQPAVDPAELDAVKSWFAGELDLRIERPESELRGHERLPPTLGEQLAHVATYPGALPYELGLVRYFTLKPKDEAHDLKRASITAYPLLNNAAAPAPGSPPVWTDPIATTVQAAPIDLAKPLLRGTLGPDLGTYWIRIEEPRASWGDDLTVRCREATDFFARATELVRGRLPVPSATLIKALAAYAQDPWRRIKELAKAAGLPLPAEPQPDLTPEHVVSARAGEGDKLLALPVRSADDVLIWCWEAWTRTPAPSDLLRDGHTASVYGAAAAHRARAQQLAETIIKADTAKQFEVACSATKQALQLALGANPADAAWLEWVDNYCATLWADLAAEAKPTPQAKPAGITAQFDEMVDGVMQDRDLWDQLAGIGVLIRRKRPSAEDWLPWRLLSAAHVVRVDDKKKETPLYVGDNGAPAAAVIPYRFHARDGIYYPFVTYEHKSLVTGTALDDFIGKQYDARGEVATIEARVAYKQAVAGTRDLLLPPLRYGDQYQLAAFAIDLAGGVPAGVSEPGLPFRVKAFTQQPDDADGTGAFGLGRTSVPNHTGELTYLRDVPVGALRVRRADRSNERDVPDGIRPLAQRLLPPSREIDKPPIPLVVRKGWRENATAVPLVRLEVKPPAVDIDVLERWVGIAKAKPARVVQLASLKGDARIAVDDQARPAMAFADPAVKSLIVRLEEIQDNGAPANAHEQEIETRHLATTDFIGNAVPIAIDLDAAANVVKVGETSIKVTLPALGTKATPDSDQPAKLFRLTIDVVLHEPSATTPDYTVAKFADGIIDTTTYRIPNAYVLHLELASRRMPKPDELFGWLQFDRSASLHERMIGVQLAVPKPSRPLLRNISHGQVLRHAWRWLGRPRPPWPETGWPTEKSYPDLVWAPQPNAMAIWETTAFIDLDPQGDRIPADTIALPFGNLAWTDPTKPVDLVVDDWHADLAAQYLRYGVRVTSRYAGMFDGTAPSTVASCRDRAGTVPGWQPAYLPAQERRAKAPVLMAWLPLTHHLDDGTDHHPQRPTPILVAFHGPVHRDHGVSEGIVAELADVIDHDGTKDENGNRLGRRLLEYGRDPIDTAKAWTPPGTSAALTLDGPYGFTYEPTSAEPLFAASVYVLQPPFAADTGDDTRSLAGDFAKVRFARHIAAHDKVPLDDTWRSNADWTPPVWMHFGRAAISLVPRAARVEAGKIVIPTLGTTEGRWLYYVVVTRAVTPFGGASVSEAYVTTAWLSQRPDAGAQRWETESLSLPSDREATLYVRVLEVQVATLLRSNADLANPQKAPTGDNLWSELFPPDTETGDHAEPHYRITRVSPRVTLTRAG